MSEFDDLMSYVQGHQTAALVVGGVIFGGALLYGVRSKGSASAKATQQTQGPGAVTSSLPGYGTVDIGGQPGVLGFVGWAPSPTPTQPGATPTTPTTPATPPSSTGGTVYNWKPTGALKVGRSPGGMVWYGLYKGDSTDPNAYYINVFNRSGTLMDTINRGCVNKDTPGGEMCVGFNKDWGPGKGGPYASEQNRRDYDSIQPYGGAGGFLPLSTMSVPQVHIVQPGETPAAIARRYLGDPLQGDRFLNQNPEWEAGQMVRVY